MGARDAGPFARVDNRFGADRLAPVAVRDHDTGDRTGFVREGSGHVRTCQVGDLGGGQSRIQGFLNLQRTGLLGCGVLGPDHQFAKKLP